MSEQSKTAGKTAEAARCELCGYTTNRKEHRPTLFERVKSLWLRSMTPRGMGTIGSAKINGEHVEVMHLGKFGGYCVAILLPRTGRMFTIELPGGYNASLAFAKCVAEAVNFIEEFATKRDGGVA